MEPFIANGHDIIVALQAWRSPPLTALFRVFALLGDPEFILFLVPILLWTVDWRVGMYVALLYAGTGVVNSALKLTFDQPRPYDPLVEPLIDEVGGGFPSGHAQISVVLWGWLAHRSRRRWVLTAAAVLIFGIGLSRLYLGVHFPHDVVGGWFIGLVMLAAVLRWAPAVEEWLRRQPFSRNLVIAALPGILVGVLAVDLLLMRAGGALLGLLVGASIERYHVTFSSSGGVVKNALRIGIGLIVVVILWQGLKLALPLVPWAYYVRYAIVGLWVTLGAPGLFVAVGLASSEKREATKA